MSVQWSASLYKGFPCVTGHNDAISISIVPGRGAKTVSLQNLRTGREWIYQNDLPWEPLSYGMDFTEGDRTGWDEMFPTINACPCPNEPWAHAVYPDHGEVWSLPWSCEIAGETVRMWVHGVQVPYRLEKTYSIEGNTLHISYQVANLTPFPMSYLWAAHPLLQVREGMEIITEDHLNSVHVTYSHNGRLPLDRVEYPLAQSQAGSPIDLSGVKSSEEGAAEKYWFEGRLKQGMAGVADKETGESIKFLFHPEDTPYLAIWSNFGGFCSDYNVAVEPATGYLDNVYTAHSLQKVRTVDGYAVNGWKLSIAVE